VKDNIVVLSKFKRNDSSWICTECDTENPMSAGRCTLCGTEKAHNARVVISDSLVTYPMDIPETSEKKNKIWIILAAAAALLVIIIGICVAVFMSDNITETDTIPMYISETRKEFAEIENMLCYDIYAFEEMQGIGDVLSVEYDECLPYYISNEPIVEQLTM